MLWGVDPISRGEISEYGPPASFSLRRGASFACAGRVRIPAYRRLAFALVDLGFLVAAFLISLVRAALSVR